MKIRALLWCWLLWIPVMAVAAEEAMRLVTVAGQGSASAAPDQAMVQVSIQVRNAKMDTARSEAVAVTRRVLGLAEKLGIPDADVLSTGVTVQPEYRYNDVVRRQELVGYFVSRQISIQLKNLELLGSLIEGAADTGVNQISSPQLEFSGERELRRQALAAAAEDAAANARVLAESLGAKLGEVYQISDQQTVDPQPIQRQRTMALSAQSEASGADTYSVGEIRVEANVRVTFLLESD